MSIEAIGEIVSCGGEEEGRRDVYMYIRTVAGDDITVGALGV